MRIWKAWLDYASPKYDTDIVSKEELIKRLEKAYEAEDYFPGVLGNPVTFAARWGLPLSKGYLNHLAKRRAAATGRAKANGKKGSRGRKKAKR